MRLGIASGPIGVAYPFAKLRRSNGATLMFSVNLQHYDLCELTPMYIIRTSSVLHQKHSCGSVLDTEYL